MKFPKELSKERLSLLSPEDRKIYESEHNKHNQDSKLTLFSSPEEFDIIEPIFEEDELDETKEYQYSEEYKQMLKKIISEECNLMFGELFDDMMSFEEFSNIKYEMLSEEQFNYVDGLNAINEGAEGLDAFAWIRGLNIGWIGTLLATTLGALGTGIAYLITAGKDKLAMMKLKKYMNQVVEIIDLGRKKRRPWYSFLMPKNFAQWHGEYNNACFRTIQETADRNMCNLVMSASSKLGYFKEGNMMDISNSAAPQSGSGLDVFKNNVLSQLNVIVRPI